MKQAAIFLQLTTLICLLGHTYGGTINVPADYTTIQEGIDAAAAGDIVQVAAGFYNEDVFLKSGVVVQGEDANVTTILGTGIGPVVTALMVDADAGINSFTITGGDSYFGGGIYCYESSPTISNNVIVGNSATYSGGGIFSYVESSPTVTSNVIMSNTAGYGGGICCEFDSSRITNNVIAGNNAGYGGGIYCGNSSPTIANNLIVSNTAGYGGGGICCDDSVSPTITNNVIVGNNADHGGGICCHDSSPTILNCIIWGNGDDLDGCVATYSCIEDGDPGEGNIALNPLFVDAVNGDFHLQVGSPCIDSGIIIPELSTEDLDGNPRIADGDGNGTAVVDMGAYEYVIPVRAVLIDIKPGSLKNPINLRSRGVVPVALLSTADFDALLVSLSYVTFGPNGATPVRAASADVDGDGDLDMLFHFRQQETGITSSDTGATWKAVTGDGVQLIGEDIIHLVPKKK